MSDEVLQFNPVNAPSEPAILLLQEDSIYRLELVSFSGGTAKCFDDSFQTLGAALAAMAVYITHCEAAGITFQRGC